MAQREYNPGQRDHIVLTLSCSSLKGHFSRIEHQMATHMKKDNSHVLSNMVMHLPPGARDAYFVDQAGNVSTSKFRPAPPSPAHISTSPHLLPGSRASVLDLKPRYPVLGGWNYSFSVGWNVKLLDGWMKSQGSDYSLQIPFMTPITDVAVDKAIVQIILPEGASNVKVKVPFPVEKNSFSTKWHFLDTTGSPVIELEKEKCSERHGGSITIQYQLSPLDHYRKIFVGVVLVVAAYLSIALLSRVDIRIKG
jgi:oligosaccharyltransferase complex subunit alpha (ribophorin I)